MKCRNCGTEIADKALICYRCGVATTEPRIPRPAERTRRSPIPVIVAMLVIIAAAAAGLPYLEPGPPRITGWVVLVVVTFAAVRLLGPGRFGRKR